LPEAISKVIKSWDRENWEEIMENVVLSGGGSLIPGLKERLKVELKKYFSDKINNKINVIAPSGRESMAWIGASILHLRNQLTEEWKPNPEYKNEKGS
jgi:actin-like protein 6A